MYINQCVKSLNVDMVQIFERKACGERFLNSESFGVCEFLLYITI